MTITTTPPPTPPPAGPRHAARPPAPALSTGRIVALDVTRALAIIGMIAVHSLNEYDDNGYPTLSFSLFAGRASAAFAVLAGISISLIVGRRRLTRGPAAAGKAASLVTRALVIGVIGLLLGYTDAELGVVILVFYAAMFLLAVPLTFLGTRTLAALTAVLMVATPVLSRLVRPHIVEGTHEQLSFGYLVHSPAEFLSDVLLTGEFPALVWMTYVCAGLVIGRLTLRSIPTAVRMLVLDGAMMAAAATLSWLLFDLSGGKDAALAGLDAETGSDLILFGADGVVPASSWWWLAFDGPHTGTPLDLMATIGSTLAVLGTVILLEQGLRGRAHTAARWALAPLAAAGTMSLTVYVGHIMFLNSDFDVYGPTPGFVRQLVVIALFALAWKATAGRGPLEGLVAACTRRADAHARARAGRRAAAVTAPNR